MAVTLRAAVIDTVHFVEVPLQAPDQPTKREPVATDTESVTDVPDT